MVALLALNPAFDHPVADGNRQGKKIIMGGGAVLIFREGVFPVDFAAVTVEVEVPEEFALVSESASAWQETRNRGGRIFKSTAIEGFASAVFLPESEKEEFIQTQKILTSEKFMH